MPRPGLVTGPLLLAPGEIMMTVGLYRYQKHRWLASRDSSGLSLQLAPDIAPRSAGLRLIGSF